MGLVPGICTQCGATLSAEQGKQWMICPYCETPFLVKEAVEKFCITYNYNITGSVVHFHSGNAGEDFEAMCERAYKQEKVGAYENARKLWCDIVDKYPDRYEGWLGLIGYARTRGGYIAPGYTEMYGAEKIYSSIISLTKETEELKEKIFERILYNMKNVPRMVDKATWDFLVERFPVELSKGHQKAMSWISEMGKNSSVFATIFSRADIKEDEIKRLIKQRKDDPSSISAKIKELPICKLPCVVGDMFFIEESSSFVKARDVKFLSEVTKIILRIENGECVECGRKLNIFKKCPKCKK